MIVEIAVFLVGELQDCIVRELPTTVTTPEALLNFVKKRVNVRCFDELLVTNAETNTIVAHQFPSKHART